MAYQHLFGSTAGGSSGAGYKTLAATPDFYNVMSDDELSNYNNYTFTAGDEHPVKFCHYYKPYKQCFIQSAVSFEYDYVGRNSSIAHTLVLSENESDYILNEHICPFSPAMFMNAKSDNFERPAVDKLPAVDYRFLDCRDSEYNKNAISKLFRSEIFAQLIVAIFLSAENSYPIFIALPGTPREVSFNAIRLMNILIPAFPAEYKKKMGFMTHVTDTYAYEDVSIYFTDSMDLSRQFVSGGYIFDLTKQKPFVSGIEASAVKEYFELLRTVMGNILSYDTPALNGFYNDIQPKLDENDRFSLSKINEIFYMWRFLSGTDNRNLDSTAACRIISSFYDFYGIVDNKAAFLNRINGYWESEIEKCKDGGYAPSIDVFNIIERHYPSFGQEDKRQAQRIWSFVLIYTLTNSDSSFLDRLFTVEYDGSQLVTDIYKYILYAYTGFIIRKDNNAKASAVYERMISAYIRMKQTDNNYSKLFATLRETIEGVDGFFTETRSNRKNEYDLFSAKLLIYFEDGVTGTLNDAGMMRRFALIKELKDAIYSTCELGMSVYQHFHGGFISGVATGFTAESVTRMADDREALFDVLKHIETYPELGNVDMIALFQRYCELLNKPKDITSLYELNKLVNKPDQQKAFTGWIEIYTRKYPELALSILANTNCHIGDGASIVYDTDFMKAYTQYYDNIDRDDETMMRDLNRLIGEIETDMHNDNYKDLGLGTYKDPTIRFINAYLFDKSVDRKRVRENEARLKRFDKVKMLRMSVDTKHKKFGKK